MPSDVGQPVEVTDASTNVVERLVVLEQGVRYTEPPAAGRVPYRYAAGHLPVLLSAPHGAVHMRAGRAKGEDEYTAAFAHLVAELSGAHAIYNYRRSARDPNWDRGARYRCRLREIVQATGIRFVLDIHGAAAHRPFGIALGTIGGESCPDHEPLIVQHLRTCGFCANGHVLDRLVVNHPLFTGGLHQATITRFACRELDVPAAQFELNAHLRTVRRLPTATWDEPFEGDAARIARTVAAFVELVRVLGARK
jgi:hypothetical protein